MSTKRLSIPLDANQHRAVKLAAMLNHQTIKDYILSKLFANKNTPNDATLKAMQDIEKNNDLTSYSADSFLEELQKIDAKYRS